MNQLEDIKARVKGHTPGPWVYHSSSGRIEDVPEFDLHRFDVMAIEIAKVQESDADGHLIAAAPKLLAALEAVLNLANHEPRFRPRMYGGEYFPVSVSADEIIEVITEALQ